MSGPCVSRVSASSPARRRRRRPSARLNRLRRMLILRRSSTSAPVRRMLPCRTSAGPSASILVLHFEACLALLVVLLDSTCTEHLLWMYVCWVVYVGPLQHAIREQRTSTAEPPRSIRSSVRGCMPTSQAEVTGCGAFGSSARYTATSLLLLFGHSRPKPSSLHSVPMACSRVMMLATRAPGGHDLVALGSSVARPAPTGCWAALW